MDRPGIESRDRVILECGCPQCKSDEPLIVWIRYLEAAFLKAMARLNAYEDESENTDLLEVVAQIPQES